jgi:hypothetical protein
MLIGDRPEQFRQAKKLTQSDTARPVYCPDQSPLSWNSSPHITISRVVECRARAFWSNFEKVHPRVGSCS